MLEVSTKRPFKTLFFGVGGTGSNLLPFVAQLYNNSENSIILIDGDRIEEKNLKNQKYLSKDIGKYKSEVLAERYKKVYPKLKISSKNKYMKLNDKEEIVKSIEESNFFPIILGCVDNNITRKLLYEVFHDEKIKNIIYIDSGNGTDERWGQISIGYKKDGIILSPCIGDLNPAILEANDEIINTNSCSQVTLEKPQNISTNTLAAVNLFCIITNITSFGYIKGNFYLFNAEEVTTQRRVVGIS